MSPVREACLGVRRRPNLNKGEQNSNRIEIDLLWPGVLRCRDRECVKLLLRPFYHRSRPILKENVEFTTKDGTKDLGFFL